MDKKFNWSLKDRAMFFVAKLILVPILFVFVMLMVIREQVEYWRHKGEK